MAAAVVAVVEGETEYDNERGSATMQTVGGLMRTTLVEVLVLVLVTAAVVGDSEVDAACWMHQVMRR